MGHSGLPGKRRSAFGETIFTPRAHALSPTPASTSGDTYQAVRAGEKTSLVALVLAFVLVQTLVIRGRQRRRQRRGQRRSICPGNC
jgi:hypothetical protein